MRQTKLILMEGLPSTGKSTNAGFIIDKLERNGHRARWVHEVARPHPTLFFFEAALDETEYNTYISRYPHMASILGQRVMKYGSLYGIDLLELEWNQLEVVGKDALHNLKQYDVWNYSIDRYAQIAVEKWVSFVSKLIGSDEVVILDSSIFQFQIYSFLLAGKSYEELRNFIQKLYDIITPLHPTLVYYYRENTNDSIDFLVRERGIRFLERIWERDRNRPYYKDRPAGSEGYKMLLSDYGEYAKKLFDNSPCPKLAVEITEGNWSEYESSLLEFLDISYVQSEQHHVMYPEGQYYNDVLDQTIEIAGDCFITPGGGRKRIMPKSATKFGLNDLPVTIEVDGGSLILTGEQLTDRWTTRGTVFGKIWD
ncbi:hypothetical protein H8B09_06645 [Paenibacillus sp. PR3]|uniref:Thymidylate kinase n=1 Tax=Paenibacillus terricola TaxID=2763503 RepID=A0ABR8MR08_9BACL|nr:hypothetical protein [Paenibacillus terricola]MBD3918428.1 hypothetical protein [Paenibacillus terricola]